jgi:hypothetical protein
MIRVQGENPSTALMLHREHAHRLVPLVHALAATLLLGHLGQDDHTHLLAQSKVGANSFGLYLADGREFHFRGDSARAHYDTIHVYDRWTYRRDNVAPLATLRTADEAVAWARTLRFNPMTAKRNGMLIRAA